MRKTTTHIRRVRELPNNRGKILFNPGDAESLHGNLRKGAIRQRGTLAKIDEARFLFCLKRSRHSIRSALTAL